MPEMERYIWADSMHCYQSQSHTVSNWCEFMLVCFLGCNKFQPKHMGPENHSHFLRLICSKKCKNVNTSLTNEFRGSTPCTGQTWRGWISVLVCQRCANELHHWELCSISDFQAVIQSLKNSSWWGFQAWDTLLDSTDDSSINKVQTSLEWQQHFSPFQDMTDKLSCHIHLPVCLWIMDPHSRAPQKNTSHGNEALPQGTMHLIQRPCYQRGSMCQDPASNWTTRRPPPHHKEMQTAVVWSCFPFITSGQNHPARRSERGQKTEEEVGRQQQGMDRPGVHRVPEGSGEQGKKEETSREITWGAPTTLAVKG